MKTLLIFVYNFFLSLVYIVTFPYILFKRLTSKKEWDERFGNYRFDYSRDKESIWVHGASVGEITAASKLSLSIKKEFPNRRVIVSSMTITGKERAKKLMQRLDHFILLPFDFYPLISRGISKINPGTLILVETEIWPSMLYITKRRGTKVVLANGRISDGTYRRYLLLKPFISGLLGQIDLIFPKSYDEERKFLMLGVSQKKIKMLGSLKSDNSQPEAMSKEILNIPQDKKVVVAGSIRKGEEEIIIKVLKNLQKTFKNIYFVIAPRHLNRVGDIEIRLQKEDLIYRKRTENGVYKGENVLILDTIGELREVYSIANVAFVGGTLLPYGGHNLIEPAVFGVPILFGPHVNNTKKCAQELLEAKGGIIVKDEKELYDAISELLNHPEKSEQIGKNARDYLTGKEGVVENYLITFRNKGVL